MVDDGHSLLPFRCSFCALIGQRSIRTRLSLPSAHEVLFHPTMYVFSHILDRKAYLQDRCGGGFGRPYFSMTTPAAVSSYVMGAPKVHQTCTMTESRQSLDFSPSISYWSGLYLIFDTLCSSTVARVVGKCVTPSHRPAIPRARCSYLPSIE